MRIAEGRPVSAGSRRFDVDLEPVPDLAWRVEWEKSSKSVTVDGRTIPIGLFGGNLLQFDCAETTVERVIFALDALIAGVNAEHGLGVAGESARQKVAEEAQQHIDELAARLEQLPPPAT